METSYILAVDQSTSGTKALLIDKLGQIKGRYSIEHPQIYPKPGWVEHDPLVIYGNVVQAIQQVLRTTGTSPGQVAVITITNQRETAVVWDKETGQPVYNAIVWQCRRTAEQCADLKAKGYESIVKDKTGLVLDPYFSASKIRWILEHMESDTVHNGGQNQLLAGTIDSWLIWKLTGGAVHATDYTNASRTSLFNIHTLQWDSELIEMFGVDRVTLPEVKSSNDLFGYTNEPALFSEQIPISGVIGDSQAALFGQLCHQPGMAKATYGTGTSVMMNIGSKAAKPANGLVTAIAWGIDGKVDYALEGIIHCTGDCLKWVRDQLGLFNDYSEAEAQASALSDNEGVYLIPAFVGLGVPYWEPNAKAAVIGLSRSSDKRHIIRAALESIAYQVRDTAELMVSESGIRIQGLRVDGGATENRFLMQFQADMLQIDVVKPSISELSAVGSAFLGGLCIGTWNNIEELYELFSSEMVYSHLADANRIDEYYEGWKKAVHSIIS
ncbi:glycerol kinase GlpK [Paenibacillus radicis (ex Xue et al. 2023)]|uniref:ATP:glycerol 3-phosphotransferase n=1 Tax=Paenibacillus radicis (ex Xue et al. 2023) TaxID=2972489 RepID=A0ABT1YBF2_9BACL|nr:glycerol kinase GlpK [Paenibacillus radicis (ex Xue et al. 2023)]MCR8630520.1 glycerol kinase GlpK [Paenibacillus radicis (ex Xue et al. 2023)]